MATGGAPDLSSIQDNIESQNDEILALQAIFDDDADRLEILGSATQVDDGELSNLNTLKMYVPVTCPGKLHVDCYIPFHDDHIGAQGVNQGVQLTRSDSGQRMVFSFEVTYLPPVCLHVTLPETYPSYDPPVFVLSCVWLSPAQLTMVCQHLDRLWEETKGDVADPGMPILYTWLDWIQENILSELGITSHLLVSTFQIDDDIDDCRVVVDCDLDLNAIVTHMVRNNQLQLQKEFSQSEQECSICYDVNLGTKFFILPECSHHVCRECLTSHCQLLVKEGTVLQIRCPMYECKANIPPHVLRDILTSEEFDRFESLSLQKGLEVMGDVTWCPRCNNVVIKEPDKNLNLAQCLKCFFTFCTVCMEKWHQGEVCNTDEELQDTKDKRSQRLRDQELKQHERRKLEQKAQNKESTKYILQFAKRCPKCNAPIMKIGGCNKVVCGSCHASMCYVCEKLIDGYFHFTDNAKCSTFTFDVDIIDNTDIKNPEALRVVRAQNIQYRPLQLPNEGKIIQNRIKDNPELKAHSLLCPTCKQTNLKEDPSNHIRCWNCKTNICYSCKQTLRGSVGRHYSGTNVCQQHTPL